MSEQKHIHLTPWLFWGLILGLSLAMLVLLPFRPELLGYWQSLESPDAQAPFWLVKGFIISKQQAYWSLFWGLALLVPVVIWCLRTQALGSLLQRRHPQAPWRLRPEWSLTSIKYLLFFLAMGQYLVALMLVTYMLQWLNTPSLPASQVQVLAKASRDSFDQSHYHVWVSSWEPEARLQKIVLLDTGLYHTLKQGSQLQLSWKQPSAQLRVLTQIQLSEPIPPALDSQFARSQVGWEAVNGRWESSGNGLYTASLVARHLRHPLYSTQQTWQDLALEASISGLQAGGLWVRAQEDLSHADVLVFKPPEMFWTRFSAGKWTELSCGKISLPLEIPQPVELQLVAAGQHLLAIANEHWISHCHNGFSAPEPPLPGSVSLYTERLTGTVFHSVKLWELPPGPAQ